MTKVGRNDPCPCGSGKKYKKCCEKKVVSIDTVVDQEVQGVQGDILAYALENYEMKIETFLEKRISELGFPEELEELFDFYCLVWIVFCKPMEGDQTIIESFIEKRSSHIKRPIVRQMVESWQEAVPSVYRVVSQQKEGIVQVEDIFTKDQDVVKILEEDRELEIDSLLIGALVPFRNEMKTFFTIALDLIKEEAEGLDEAIVDLFDSSDELDPAMFMCHSFPEVFEAFFLEGGELEVSTDDLEWDQPIYEQVAALFQDSLEKKEYPEIPIQTGILLWNIYCQKKSPRIKNPTIYVAAIHYLIETIIELVPVTQTELAEEYGVSSTSISSKYKDMESVLGEELMEIVEEFGYEDDEEYDIFSEGETPFLANGRFFMERQLRETERQMEGKDFDSIEELNALLNEQFNQSVPRNEQLSPREQAQELLFDAYDEEVDRKRLKLVDEALKLYPNSPDAYNILAEEASSLGEAKKLFEQAIKVGEEDLGSEFFQENKGHFWGITSTRPYMRAKLQYAIALWDSGERTSAIEQYEEILVLNEQDNQGVRYFLQEAYMKLKQYDKAEKLMKQYDEDITATNEYNEVLLDYINHGIRRKTETLLHEAFEQNPYVIDYLLRKKKLPKQPPAYFGIGDEREAIMYVQAYGSVWWEHESLISWLKDKAKIMIVN